MRVEDGRLVVDTVLRGGRIITLDGASTEVGKRGAGFVVVRHNFRQFGTSTRAKYTAFAKWGDNRALA